MNYRLSCSKLPHHAIDIAGGPQCVIAALAASMEHILGYSRQPQSEGPRVLLVVDSMDERPDDVVSSYVSEMLNSTERPIPLFLTARPKRFRRRGLMWEPEFLFASGTGRLHELAARIRMLVRMWGNSFPLDVARDAVVGSFRMMMHLDADDYHHRSPFVEDLQRIAEWDGKGAPPAVRSAPKFVWTPPLTDTHPYAQLFASSYQQISRDISRMLLDMQSTYETNFANNVRDRAGTILRKIPSVSGRFVHSLRDTPPTVLVIDDEAEEIVSVLNRHRVGHEGDSALLGDIFRFVAHNESLKGEPVTSRDFEQLIREWITGQCAPGDGSLTDLRSADLILLDLSLDQGPESELAGFIILKKLRNAIPDIPLVIHTGSADLAHIIQAIRDGADWYVMKDAARAYSDLASILNHIGRRPEWRKSADRLQSERRICNLEDLPEELRNEKYLYIWRSLAADLPKGELEVNYFSSGASGAITCGVHVMSNDDPAGKLRRPVTSFVVKIDRPYVMVSERERFRALARPRIGNRAGRVESDVVHAGEDMAGIAYTFSGLHQGQSDVTRSSLVPMFTFLDRMLNDERDARFTDVASMFDDLLNGLLKSLHESPPAGSRSGWAEPLFDETLTLRDSHELRLPPFVEIELTDFGPASTKERGELHDEIGREIFLPLCRIQKTAQDHVSVTFVDPGTQRLHRARLTGEIAHFMAQFRNLRPKRALSIRGVVSRHRSNFYDAIRREAAEDLEWLSTHERRSPLEHIEELLAEFDRVEPETIGIVHGDLNLDNVLVDVDSNGRPVPKAVWLIDFARTRRDSLAHDFVELEVELVTRMLGPAHRRLSMQDRVEFLRSLDAGPLHPRQHFDGVQGFVNEACHFVRRAAAAASIGRREYLASLAMYYLVALKLNHPSRRARDSESGDQICRWSLAGITAALDALGIEDTPIMEPGRDHIPVKLRGSSNEPPSQRFGVDPARPHRRRPV